MKGVQLPLGVELPETASFDSFVAGPNAEVVRALCAGDAPLTLIYGPAGSGKTHLLQALLRRAAESQGCAYLPLRLLAAENPLDATEGLDTTALLCVDDAEVALASSGWSEALLRLLDTRRATGRRTVVAAAAAPDRLEGLPDLRTRFAAGAVYGLKPLGESALRDFLQDRARARGLELPLDAADYLLARLSRDAGSLNAALERLDRALLSAQRPLTLNFVQQWLKQP